METTKTATYQEWIQFLFDHDESQGDWRFTMHNPLKRGIFSSWNDN